MCKNRGRQRFVEYVFLLVSFVESILHRWNRPLYPTELNTMLNQAYRTRDWKSRMALRIASARITKNIWRSRKKILMNGIVESAELVWFLSKHRSRLVRIPVYTLQTIAQQMCIPNRCLSEDMTKEEAIENWLFRNWCWLQTKSNPISI